MALAPFARPRHHSSSIHRVAGAISQRESNRWQTKDGGGGQVLNECVLSRGAHPSMLHVSVNVDDHHISTVTV